MNHFKYVFSQLVSFLDRNHFNHLVRKYGGDSYVKSFMCWNQLFSTIICYCMMAIVQKKLGADEAIYEMLQIASISFTDTTPIRDLFGKPNYNNVNERNGPTEPSLFDCLTF